MRGGQDRETSKWHRPVHTKEFHCRLHSGQIFLSGNYGNSCHDNNRVTFVFGRIVCTTGTSSRKRAGTMVLSILGDVVEWGRRFEYKVRQLVAAPWCDLLFSHLTAALASPVSIEVACHTIIKLSPPYLDFSFSFCTHYFRTAEFPCCCIFFISGVKLCVLPS